LVSQGLRGIDTGGAQRRHEIRQQRNEVDGEKDVWRGPGSRESRATRKASSPPTAAVGSKGLDAVFAVGDATTFPIKQGGLATQQADAAAEAIAGLAGADVVAEPFRPVLRGLILTGGAPLYARAELSRAGNPASVATDALWWPPGKIVGRYLAPYLAERSGAILEPPTRLESVTVEADLSSLASAK